MKVGTILKKGDKRLFPWFYIENGLEPWLRQTVDAWIQNCANWIY